MASIRESLEVTTFKALYKKLATTVQKSDQSTEEIISMVNAAEKVTGNLYTKEGWDGIRESLSDPNNRWLRIIRRAFRDVDEHILDKNLMNIVYYASIAGIRTKRKMIKKHHCNIPNIILFDPTTACNLHCKGCWSAEYGHKWNLSYEEMEDIVRQGEEMGCHLYFMTGGEPLVRKDDIIRLAEKFPNSAFHIFTNATLIDDAFCAEVRRVGNITFAVSIEGFEDQNDARRGEGAYQHIVESMTLMKRNRIGFAASICYTSANYETVTSDTFLQQLVDLGCFHVWYFHYMPIGQGAVPELLLTAEQRKYMIERIRYLRTNEADIDLMLADFQNDGQFVGGCIAGGRNYIHINAKGDLEPCVFIHYSNSNIRDKSILEGMKEPLMMAYYHEEPWNDNHFKPCPMLENPDLLPNIVKNSNAKSTDYVAEEMPEDLYKKTAPYAAQWTDTADELWEEYGKYGHGDPAKRSEMKEKMEKQQEEIREEMEAHLNKAIR